MKKTPLPKAKPLRPPLGKAARDQAAVLGVLKGDPAAWMLGISARTLTSYVDAPRSDAGTYDARVLVAWWVKREVALAAPAGTSALERMRVARAEAVERKNAIEVGRLIKADDAAAEARAIGNALRSQFEAVVRAYPQVEKEIREALDRAEAQLAEKFEEGPKK